MESSLVVGSVLDHHLTSSFGPPTWHGDSYMLQEIGEISINFGIDIKEIVVLR